MGGSLIGGVVVGGFLTLVAALSWPYDYGLIEEANQVAIDNCGEGNITSIALGEQTVYCKDGRKISWESKND